MIPYPNLVQGTTEWLAHRIKFRNASDAPAMMGCSPYQTRTQLLHAIHTGLTVEIDAGTQQVFDNGHRYEALARPLAEEIIGEDLYPVVGTQGTLGASFDGLTMDNSINMEHKTLNANLKAVMVEGCTGADLPLMYRVQMEQQMMVSGAEKTLFMASTWMGKELVEERHCWYLPDMDLRAQIIAGWAQFEFDLAAYVPGETVVEVVGRTPDNLPALHIEVTGKVMASNLAQYKDHALAVFASINRKLETDQHFADAEKAVRWCADVESRAEAAKQHALSQTETIDALFNAIDSIRDEARNVRLELEKLVKARKEAIRLEIVQEGQKALLDHVTACNERIGHKYLPIVIADFNGAIKGKKTIESLRNAVNTVLANAKIDANKTTELIVDNMRHLEEVGKAYMASFPDLGSIVTKASDDFKATVSVRISAAKAAEEAARTKAIKDFEDLEKSEIARLAAANNTMVQEAQTSTTIAITGNPPFSIAAVGTVKAISQMRQDLNAHLDTLDDQDLERVLHFCQSRYPLQKAA